VHTSRPVFVWLQILCFCGLAGGILATGSPVAPQLSFQVRIPCFEEEVPPIGEEFQVDIVLRSAAQGLQRYELIVHVGDESGAGAIARIVKIQPQTIRAEHFRVVSQTSVSIWFKAMDVEDRIPLGSTDVLLATLTLRTLVASRSLVLRLEAPTAMIDDHGQEIDPQEILFLPVICQPP
jgi:hypothetical protein